MTTNIALTLWANHSSNRFFLVPDKHPFLRGEFLLRTITGREQRVDESALAGFEVTEEQAKEWVKGEFGKILDTARGAVNRFVEKLRGGPGEPNCVADLCELLDRLEALVELMISETGDGELAAEDIASLMDRLDRIRARLQELMGKGQRSAAGRSPMFK
jgi:hypothetical protein